MHELCHNRLDKNHSPGWHELGHYNNRCRRVIISAVFGQSEKRRAQAECWFLLQHWVGSPRLTRSADSRKPNAWTSWTSACHLEKTLWTIQTTKSIKSPNCYKLCARHCFTTLFSLSLLHPLVPKPPPPTQDSRMCLDLTSCSLTGSWLPETHSTPLETGGPSITSRDVSVFVSIYICIPHFVSFLSHRSLALFSFPFLLISFT